MKAVVWTDAVQTIIMVAGILITITSAILFAGGFQKIFEICSLHGRTNLLM